MAQVRGLPPRLRRAIFGRALLLQACWNFERMQNLGFALCVDSWAAGFFAKEEDRRKAVLRHLEPFNTMPFMSGLLVGMVCRGEEETARLSQPEQAAARERLRAVKAAAACALAGIGDSLFWAVLRPACAAGALALALWARPKAWAVGVGAASYLAAFNAPALWLRWRGPDLGYRWGEEFASKLGQFPVQAVIRKLRLVGFAAALAAAAALVFLPVPGVPLLCGLAAFAAAALKRRPVSLAALYAAVCALGAAARAAGWA